MKPKQILFIAVLTSCYTMCTGQDAQIKNEIFNIYPNYAKDSIIFVFKVEDKMAAFIPHENETVDLGFIEPFSIESISVLKANEAINKYGPHAKGGAVIITFKDFDLLPKDMQKMLHEPFYPKN
jgi:hypothetical protein